MNEEFMCLNAQVSRRRFIQSAIASTSMFPLIATGTQNVNICASYRKPSIAGDSLIAKHPSKCRTVGYLMFEDMDVLDFGGPYEVFWQARQHGQNDDEYSLFTSCTIAERLGTIRCDGGLTTTVSHTFDEHPPIDILLIPGGPGAFQQCRNRRLLDWIIAESKKTEITAGVCTGAFPLAETGLLNGRRATTYWQEIASFRRQYPNVKVLDNTRFVDEGRFVTSAGISAGIDMALQLVDRLHGDKVASWTARRIEYDYWPQAKNTGQHAD